MNALLGPLRQIARDLMDKRLWPVALLLLAALVAAPLLIGGSGAEPAAPAAPAAGAAAPGTAAATPHAVADAGDANGASKPAKAERSGKIDDPFFDPPSPPGEAGGGAPTQGGTQAVAKSPTGEAAPRPGGTGADASTAKSPAATSPAATKPAAPKPAATRAPAATAPASSSYLRTVVRLGRGKALPIARLTPLGGSTHPGAVFLGIAKADARYAVFVLGPRATSRGQATCKGATDCRLIGLKAGQSQLVTVRLPNGGVRRLRLRVRSIRAVRTSAARARAARAKTHQDGRRVVRRLRRHAATAATLRTARYDGRAGLLRATAADAVKNAAE